MLRHPGILLRRESAAQVFVRCSAIELQQLSSLAGIEPATVGSRCNPGLHHAANSSVSFLLISIPLYSSSAHTCSAHAVAEHLRSESEPLNIPGGIGAHGLSGFEPEPFGLASEVTVNFTIPGSCFFAKYFDDKKIYAVPVA